MDRIDGWMDGWMEYYIRAGGNYTCLVNPMCFLCLSLSTFVRVLAC